MEPRTGGRRRLATTLGACAVVACTVAASTVAGTMSALAAPAPAGKARPVIVQAVPGQERAAAVAILRLGGTALRPLAIIHGFSATVPASAVPALSADPDVRAVTPDAPIHPMGGGYDPGADVNSMANTAGYVGAPSWWTAGYTGKGVDVALIDTGVSPVQGLSGSNKLLFGPDLSLDSQVASETNYDGYGHGTFMAGLIAGHDDGLTQPYAKAPASQYRGVAPDARIISMKVGTADGGTDVSQVIAAIDWVVQHRSDPGLNIRVINLSYGTNSLQPYLLDPLAFAAETAWKKGIVVVAAAGNSGYQLAGGAKGLADPAYDPYVMAVGASDSMGTRSQADDTVPNFSAWSICSPLCKNPDIVAPGRSLEGLRDPGSYIDTNYPTGELGNRYFRGSGTSQATAIMSGAVALVLQKYPSLTPDRVKAFVTGNAYRLKGAGSNVQGAGELQMGGMLTQSPPQATQRYLSSTGLGLLEGSRGLDHVTQNDVVLAGEQDIFGHVFDCSVLSPLEALAQSWLGGVWNGNIWAGSGWVGKAWSSVGWAGNDWSGKSWSNGTWSGKSWSDSGWTGGDWSSKSWSGSSWTGGSWAGGSWS